MQTVYRVNTISSYKPWRSGGPYLITDKSIFEQVKALDNDDDFYRIPAPDAEFDENGEPLDEDNTLVEWLYNQQDNECVEMPYILADEITFYVE